MANGNGSEITTEETCEVKSFERNKYFYGKLMTVKDFEAEQKYFNGKRYLLNGLIHGVGIVCGVEASEPAIVSQKLQIKLSRGVALDCCGHEIVVESGGTFDVEEGSPSDGVNYVYLKYRECLTDPSPAPANPSVCEEVCCYSRIREEFKLQVSPTPPEVAAFDWAKVWQARQAEIETLASKLGLPVPRDEIEARFIITADEYLTKAACPACTDPKVLVGVVRVAGSNATIDTDEIATLRSLRSLVYSNPMLHELIRGHLGDLDNPHQVTADQTKALMSLNNVGNAPARKTWVQNVDIVSDGSITVAPHAAAKTVEVKTTHAQINPLPVDPASTDTTRDKHVANDDAHRWSQAPVSVDGLTNPGGDIDLVAGTGIRIDHPAGDGAPQISISAVAGATTGVVKVTIPRATVPQETKALLPPVPGAVVSQDIAHGLEAALPPAVVLGYVGEKIIIMEQDFILQRPLVEVLAKQYGIAAPPLVSFRAAAVTEKKFNIVAINTNPEAEETVVIRWWAIPAGRTVRELPADVMKNVKDTVGEEIIQSIVTERNIPAEAVDSVINEVVNAVAEAPEGMTPASLASVTGLPLDAVNPVLGALVASASLVTSGKGANRRYLAKG